MISFKRSHLIVGAILMAASCNCSARTWYEFFTSPFQWAKSWYTGNTTSPQQESTLVTTSLGANDEQDLLFNRLLTLKINDYSAAACNNLEAEVSSGVFDTVINNNIFVNSRSGSYASLLGSLVLHYMLAIQSYVYGTLSLIPNPHDIFALGNLIATTREHGGKVINEYQGVDNFDDNEAFRSLSKNYRLLRIAVDGSESLIKKGEQSLEEHELIVQLAAQCKELARLFYAGDPALFEDALMQLPPHIEAFAERISKDIKEDPKFREALITVIPEIIKHMDKMVAPEEANFEEPKR